MIMNNDNFQLMIFETGQKILTILALRYIVSMMALSVCLNYGVEYMHIDWEIKSMGLQRKKLTGWHLKLSFPGDILQTLP